MNRLEKATLWFLATHLHFICFNLVLVQPTSYFSNTSSSHHCFNDDSIALLQLKNSFTVDNLSAISSWNKDIDCCKWEGIVCHPTTYHVITLDLSNNGITGTIENNSTLFHLYQLETLNLAFNYFSGSPISPKFGLFSSLKQLNLSGSFFSGDVPIEIGQLSKLETLDLSYNSMKMSSFDMVISNMTGLKRLDLGDTFFDSVVLPTLCNLSSLEYLSLFGCKLHEEVPFGILNLPHLEYLEVGANTALYANFELYNWSSPLHYLGLHFVNFSNEIPALPGQAPYKLLRVIHLSGCNFQGEVPSWMWSIPKLEEIVIGNNQIFGVPSCCWLVDFCFRCGDSRVARMNKLFRLWTYRFF